MSKLCQCRLEKLEKKYWEHVEECSLMDCVAEGNMILIQDCVCEKKEERPYIDTHKFSPTGWREVNNTDTICRCDIPKPYYKGFNNVLQTCKNCGGSVPVSYESKEEKQSQSPCEKWNHSFIENKLEGRTPSLQKLPSGEYMYVKRQITLWTCRECGLVTCVDPSRSAPSKNPNN